MKPVLTPTVIGVGVVSGLFWALGQANQLKSIDLMGVSRTMPISTGLQLVATTLFGVIVFHEWSTTISVVLGILALVCIIIGVILTSLQSEEEKNAEQAANFKRGIVILLISTVGYLVYVVVIRLFNVDGWSALLPQAVGMVLGGILLTFKHHPFNKYAIRNIIPINLGSWKYVFIHFTAACWSCNKFLAIANGNYYFHAWWDPYIR